MYSNLHLHPPVSRVIIIEMSFVASRQVINRFVIRGAFFESSFSFLEVRSVVSKWRRSLVGKIDTSRMLQELTRGPQ